MQLPKGVEWAAHSLVVLELTRPPHPVSSSRLAEAYALSATYLNKHLQRLVRVGLLSSTSGPSGGFTLIRPGNEITLADVVEGLEGSARLFRCTEIRCNGVFRDRGATVRAAGPCGIDAAMAAAEEAWRGHLATVTIADLAAGVDERSRATLTDLINRTT